MLFRPVREIIDTTEILLKYGARRKKKSDIFFLTFIFFLLTVTLFYFYPSLFRSVTMDLIALTLLIIDIWFYGQTEDMLFLIVGISYVLSMASILIFRSLLPFALIWAVGVGIFYFWSQSNYPVTVEYHPPRGVSPEEIAYMVEDREADERELLVTLLELERKGVIELIPTKNDIYVRKLKEPEEVKDLNELEKFVMTRVFTMTGIRTILEVGVNLNYQEFPSEFSLGYVLDNLTEWKKAFDLTFRDYLTYYKPIYYRALLSHKKRIFLIGIASIVWALAWGYLNAKASNSRLSSDHSNYFLSFLIFGISTSLMGWFYTGTLTKFGKINFARIKGFEEFLKRVEWPRLRWMLKTGRITVSELFIYSIAFKLFNRWNFWMMRIKGEKELITDELAKIESLWKLISKRWRESVGREEQQGF